MSWFNDTFGDSLNSIKGQITKITKEVLAEDDNEKEDDAELIRSQVKELDALCASKDLEILSLREENKKISHRFQEELQFLRNENKKLKMDSKGKHETVLLGDDQIQQICELENELHQLRIERDHLEELQKDHQSNICLIMKQRDSSKSELEKLKMDYADLKLKYKALQNEENDSRVTNALSDVNLMDVQNRNDELVNLKHLIEKLQCEIHLHQKEKEETSKLIETITFENRSLKEQVEKLMEEIKILINEKGNIELDNCTLRGEISSVRDDLKRKNDDFESEHIKQYELEEKLRTLTETLENIKLEQSNSKQDLENQVKKLLNIFLINTDNASLSSSINLIENLWKKNLMDKENAEKIHNEIINKFQNEIQRFKNDKINLEHEIKVGIEKINELECDYRKEINSLQNKYLELKSQEQDCLIKSQTDDVKRLDQEVKMLVEIVEVKNKELGECYSKINAVTQELNAAKSLTINSEEQLVIVRAERDETEKRFSDLKSNFERKEKEIMEALENENKIREKFEALEGEKAELLQQSEVLQTKFNETVKLNEDLKNALQSVNGTTIKMSNLQRELEEMTTSKNELEKIIAGMQKMKLNSDNESENLKAQLIVKESKVCELSAKNESLTEEISKIKERLAELQGTEEELKKWKEIMVELEIQRQELTEQNMLLDKECASLSSQLITEKRKADELEHVKCENANLIEVCNKLQNEAQNKVQNVDIKQKETDSEAQKLMISSLQTEVESLRVMGQQQGNIIESLTHENNQLKNHIQLMSENLTALSEENNQLKATKSIEPDIKEGMVVNPQNRISRDKFNVFQQHKRSKSDFDTGNSEEADINKLRLELENLKKSSHRQRQEYETLQEQHAVVSEKEAHARKELERLKLHLIEIENYYTETIDEYKTKLSVTEEQLKNSSTVYTSTKVRDNQHLESLQGQIRLISAQRDDLQVKLSAAEDEVQKHKAALTSFHVVLEQFQQDKEREIESLSTKYENQVILSKRRFTELQQEINSLNNQLSDAKIGLKAASRLGEQLERKSEQIMEMEKRMTETKSEMKELEERVALANQSNFGKVDKSLVKNLLLGYISAQKGDRKTQVLRIMMSVLDFDAEERNKIGMDNSHSGWLSHLLHPRGDGMQTSQSLSEAFIRFLENESRPQPQLKLLPERSPQMDKTNSSVSKPQPSLLLQELVLPTFNSPQTNESTILKDVLNDT